MSDINIARLAKQFLDVEAVIDDEEYDEQDAEDQEDDMGAFIQDDEEDSEAPQHNVTAIEEAPAEFWEDLINNAIEHAQVAQVHRRGTSDNLLENSLPFVPHEEDYPLWRVPCRTGIEDEAIISLMRTAGAKHKLRAAFSREPGYVYLECTMNMDLRNLLEITPGLRGFGHRRRETINVGDYAAVMDFKDGTKVGEWVTIRRGLYRGDLGIVDSKDSWGVVVLVVPRLSPTSKTSQKRKATNPKPRAKLLDLDEQRSSTRYRIKNKGPHKYRIGRLDFEYGLLKRYFNFSVISRHPSDAPCNPIGLFLSSAHPRIDKLSIPRPREWSFQIGDKVQVLPTSRIGFITVVETLYAEVDCSVDSSILDDIRVPWQDIVKFFKVGDEVEILNGPHQGLVGWVTNVTNEISTVTIPETKNFIVNAGQESVSLNNNLRLYSPPQTLQPAANAPAPMLSTGKHWWVGREVTILKDRHPNRGERGHVVDVIPTADPLVSKVLIKLNAYRPALPQLSIVLEAKDVRDVKTRKRLEGPEPEKKNTNSNILKPSDLEESGSRTPMPDEKYGGSTPAWDPCSMSPRHIAMLNWDSTASNSSTPLPPKPTSSPSNHILLNPLFEGLQIKAIVNGDEFKNKECIINITKQGSTLMMTTKKQRSTIRLNPLWVTPKPVNAKLDDNLLAIVSGEHVGKLGRRIHHLDGLEGPRAVILAIVKRQESASDALTGEQVEVSPTSVAIVVESSGERQAKKDLMKDLRAPWQGR